MSEFAAIIFDMDGVLVDSEPIHRAAFLEICSGVGLSVSEEEIYRYKGQPMSAIYRSMASEHPEIASIGEKAFIKQKADAFDRMAKKEIALFPDAKPFLQLLCQRDYKMALVTSASSALQSWVFEKFELTPFFDRVITADDVKIGKPDPEPYLLAAERLNVEPEACWVIEDATNGIVSAKAAECYAVGITHTFPRKALLEAGADLVVSSFNELLPILSSF